MEERVFSTTHAAKSVYTNGGWPLTPISHSTQKSTLKWIIALNLPEKKNMKKKSIEESDCDREEAKISKDTKSIHCRK